MSVHPNYNLIYAAVQELGTTVRASIVFIPRQSSLQPWMATPQLEMIGVLPFCLFGGVSTWPDY
jgi:hypothetical protein